MIIAQTLTKMMTVLNLDIPAFLRDYWQKKPCVLRNALPDFVDFIDEHELAGLAMEPELDSRVISKQEQGWSIQQGPFEDFTACQGQWTLLVQGVDRYLDEASELMDWFNFIPNWRVDDLMISFAVPGAGVGPHVDQYDVFLLQGKGSRRWRVGAPEGLTTTQPAKGLCQVETFTPLIDCELQPGDILYIPPGWPHDGVTLADSLTYSIGFRAPDQPQLGNYLAEHLQTLSAAPERYTDPALTHSDSPAEVPDRQLQALKSLLHRAIDANSFSKSLLTMLSEQGIEPDTGEPADSQLLQDCLANDGRLVKLPGCRPLLNETFPDCLFINGEVVNFSAQNYPIMCKLVAQPDIDRSDMAAAPDELDIFCTFTTLVNMGYWEF